MDRSSSGLLFATTIARRVFVVCAMAEPAVSHAPAAIQELKRTRRVSMSEAPSRLKDELGPLQGREGPVKPRMNELRLEDDARGGSEIQTASQCRAPVSL